MQHLRACESIADGRAHRSEFPAAIVGDGHDRESIRGPRGTYGCQTTRHQKDDSGTATGTKICGTVMASCIAHPVLSTMDNGSKMCQKEEVSQFIL